MKTLLTTKGKIWITLWMLFAFSYQIVMKSINSGDALTNLSISLSIVIIITALMMTSQFTLRFKLEREVNE